jgi:hypothetical protein
MTRPLMTVVIAVGPKADARFTGDTIDSIDHYARRPWRLVLVDDSARPGFCQSLRHPRETTIVPARTRGVNGGGREGGLYLNLSEGFLVALQRPFDILLKMDTDALVIGSGFEDIAADFFRVHPSVGCLGPHKWDYDGTPDDHAWVRQELLRYLTIRWGKTPITSAVLTRLVVLAWRHGYDLGESVDGGVCVYSRLAIETLHARGLLGHQRLARVSLPEDYLFGLALRACGMDLSDFGSESDRLPIGSKWQGLAASPQDLIEANKALIHSTRFWQDMDEIGIRSYFAARRS